MKKLILASLTVMAISLFFLPKVYSFQFGLGTKGFVKKVVEKGQAEGKIAKSEEEKKQNDENNGGGGGGGEEPGPLQISNVEIVPFQKWTERCYGEVSLKVKWETNKPATSKVVWMEDLRKQNPNLGLGWIYTKENATLTQQHEIEAYWVRPGTKTWLTITSNAGAEQVEEETSILTQIVPGEIGLYGVAVSIRQSSVHPSQWSAKAWWASLQEDTNHSLYFSYDNATWSWVTVAAHSYNSAYQRYHYQGEDVDADPCSRLYYKLNGMVFYVDLPIDPDWSIRRLQPEKP